MDQLYIRGRSPISLARRRYVLGRDAGCDIALQTANGSISRQHAALEWDAATQQWNVADLNSTNGVYVNGQRIMSRSALFNGDSVSIGDSTLTLHISSAATNRGGTAVVSPPQQALVPQQPIQPPAHGTFCSQCGSSQTAGAAFCQKCGNSLSATYNPPPIPAGGAGYHPLPQNQQINVNVVNKTSNGGWLAALLILLFATPLGCISIPVTLVLLALLFASGVMMLPIIVAVVAAVIVWKNPNIDPDQKPMIVGGIILGGIIIEALLFMTPAASSLHY